MISYNLWSLSSDFLWDKRDYYRFVFSREVICIEVYLFLVFMCSSCYLSYPPTPITWIRPYLIYNSVPKRGMVAGEIIE